MKALRIKNILNSLEEKIESGNITIREAAIELHKAGWINYIDIDTTTVSYTHLTLPTT